jgi:hypothetical protein
MKSLKRCRNRLIIFTKDSKNPGVSQKFDNLTLFHPDKLNPDPYPEPGFDDQFLRKISVEENFFVDKKCTIYFLTANSQRTTTGDDVSYP